jgi:hypothetical protein
MCHGPCEASRRAKCVIHPAGLISLPIPGLLICFLLWNKGWYVPCSKISYGSRKQFAISIDLVINCIVIQFCLYIISSQPEQGVCDSSSDLDNSD